MVKKEEKIKKMTKFTGNEIKERIFKFLKDSHGKKYPVKELARQLNLASYPTILKWSEVLIASGEIKAEHYGNIKLIYVEDGDTKKIN